MGLLVIAAALGIGLGFAGREEQRFERLAATDIAARLEGESKAVSVNVRPDGLAALGGGLTFAEITAHDFSLQQLPLFTEPDRSTAGRIDLLRLNLSNFSLRGLRVARLEANIPDCRYDFGLARREHQIRLSRSGEGTGQVEIRAADLAEYIVAKFAEIKTCTVELRGGWAWIEGYGEFVIVKSNFAVIARVIPDGSRKLALSEAKIYFDWQRADALAAKVLLDTLNPVVDLDADLGLHGAVDVESVRCADGLLVAAGTTRIPTRTTDNLSE
ncbi:MAG: LmeA family phospholipid-binding protein [Fimbriimonadaceae bacterium]|nr:LmeA family phospholipid-binding protein [Fimbriimonadaceae bacterium]